MSLSTDLPRPSLALRAFHAIPLIGWVAKDAGRDPDVILYAIVIALTALVLAVMTWGLPALTMTALAMVPVMFALFIWICWP